MCHTVKRHRPRSRALKPGLIRLFFHPEQCFSLINSSSIPPNHPDSSKIQTSERAHSRADHTCSDQAWTSCTYLLTMFSVWICDQSASFMVFLVLCCRFAIIPHSFSIIVCTVGMGLDELHEPGPEVSSYLVDRTNDSFTLWVHWCFVLVRAIPFHVLRE